MRWECWEGFPHHQLQRKPLFSDPGMHHGTCVTHAIAKHAVTGKRSRHSRRIRIPQVYVSGPWSDMGLCAWGHKAVTWTNVASLTSCGIHPRAISLGINYQDISISLINVCLKFSHFKFTADKELLASFSRYHDQIHSSFSSHQNIDKLALTAICTWHDSCFLMTCKNEAIR